MQIINKSERTSKDILLASVALMTLLAVSSDHAQAEEGRDFARGLKFSMRGGSLYVADGQMPQVKHASYKKSQKWAFRKEKEGWLLYTSIQPDAEAVPGEPQQKFKRMYLAYRTAPPEKVAGKADMPLLYMSEKVEPNCYWDFVLYEPLMSTRSSFWAKATCGDFKGFYLSRGPEVEDKVWSATLSREMPPDPNELYLDGP